MGNLGSSDFGEGIFLVVTAYTFSNLARYGSGLTATLFYYIGCLRGS